MSQRVTLMTTIFELNMMAKGMAMGVLKDRVVGDPTWDQELRQTVLLSWLFSVSGLLWEVFARLRTLSRPLSFRDKVVAIWASDGEG